MILKNQKLVFSSKSKRKKSEEFNSANKHDSSGIPTQQNATIELSNPSKSEPNKPSTLFADPNQAESEDMDVDGNCSFLPFEACLTRAINTVTTPSKSPVKVP